MRASLLALVLIGCTKAEEGSELVLDGPDRVVVEQLGPVEGPRILLLDGTPAPDLVVVATPKSVATVEGGVVHAVGPGEAVVEAAWEGESVAWTLVVEPAVHLRFVQAPSTVIIGTTESLEVEAHVGGGTVEVEGLKWSSSDRSIATVDSAGVVTGVSEGRVYITVEGGGAEAMAELQVMGW